MIKEGEAVLLQIQFWQNSDPGLFTPNNGRALDHQAPGWFSGSRTSIGRLTQEIRIQKKGDSQII